MAIILKSKREIEAIRRSSQLAREVLEMLGSMVRPGISTQQLDEEAHRLMNHVNEVVPDMVTYFAVALFAGLRPTELQRLDWKDIDLGKMRIRVVPEVAK